MQITILESDPGTPTRHIGCNPSVFSILKNTPFSRIFQPKNTPILDKTLIFKGSKETLILENAVLIVTQNSHKIHNIIYIMT